MKFMRRIPATAIRKIYLVIPLIFLSVSTVADVFRGENFESGLLALKSKGLLPDSTEKDSEGQFAHFHDPDGNGVIIWRGKYEPN